MRSWTLSHALFALPAISVMLAIGADAVGGEPYKKQMNCMRELSRLPIPSRMTIDADWLTPKQQLLLVPVNTADGRMELYFFKDDMAYLYQLPQDGWFPSADGKGNSVCVKAELKGLGPIQLTYTIRELGPSVERGCSDASAVRDIKGGEMPGGKSREILFEALAGHAKDLTRTYYDNGESSIESYVAAAETCLEASDASPAGKALSGVTAAEREKLAKIQAAATSR